MFIQVGAAEGAAGVVVPSWLPWVLVGMGVVVLGVVLVMLVRGRGSAGAAGNGRAAGEVADLRNQLVEVKKLAATVADDLDRRAARLERLIAQADEVLEGGRERGERVADEPVQRGGPTRARSAEAGLAPVDDLAQRVFALADQGRSAVQIAQALRQPVGNVELMLALRGGR